MKPYVKRGKNDAADAAAICEVMSRPRLDVGEEFDDPRTAQSAFRGGTIFALQRVDLKAILGNVDANSDIFPHGRPPSWWRSSNHLSALRCPLGGAVHIIKGDTASWHPLLKTRLRKSAPLSTWSVSGSPATGHGSVISRSRSQADLSKTECNRQRLVDRRDGASIVT
jgi:hypothetical protein